MAIASPGEKLVPIKDHFTRFGEVGRHFSAVPVFLHLHVSFPLRMTNNFYFHRIFLGYFIN